MGSFSGDRSSYLMGRVFGTKIMNWKFFEKHKDKVDKTILDKLNIKSKDPKLNDWKRVVKAKLLPEREVNVSFVGKYTELKDSYKSINEALEHAGIKNKAKVKFCNTHCKSIQLNCLKTESKAFSM